MRHDAGERVKFLAAQYDEQAPNGRWFLHYRQPDDILELGQLVDCMAGRVQIHTSSLGGGLFVTNSAAFAEELSSSNVRTVGFPPVAGGAAQPWPPVVTLAVCRGLRRALVSSGTLDSMEAGPMWTRRAHVIPIPSTTRTYSTPRHANNLTHTGLLRLVLRR